MMSFNMKIPTSISFGAGKFNELSNQGLPGKTALIVISNGKSVKENGFLSRLEEQLRFVGVQTVLFDKVESNPLKSTIMAGAALATKNGCDFIVALGGGSCIDAAKAISVVVTNKGDYWDYISSGSGKAKEILVKPLPVVAIPTTAGTGSEADMGAVVTNEETNEKTALVHPLLFPALSIVDPELMITVPPKYTAFQGFDALFHAVEGYVSNSANLLTEMFALTAMENIVNYLPVAIKNGADIEARTKVAFGSTLSGFVMGFGRLTSQHSLEHAMSAFHQNLPHGAGLIILSKAYFQHLIDVHACDERFLTMAKLFGIKDPEHPSAFITALEQLQEDSGVADLKMSDYGITPDEFGRFVHNAKYTMGRLFLFDRVNLTDKTCLKIYKAAFR